MRNALLSSVGRFLISAFFTVKDLVREVFVSPKKRKIEKEEPFYKHKKIYQPRTTKEKLPPSYPSKYPRPTREKTEKEEIRLVPDFSSFIKKASFFVLRYTGQVLNITAREFGESAIIGASRGIGAALGSIGRTFSFSSKAISQAASLGGKMAGRAALSAFAAGGATTGVVVFVIISIVVFIMVFFIFHASLPSGIGIFAKNRFVRKKPLITPTASFQGSWPVQINPRCTDSYPIGTNKEGKTREHLGIDIDTLADDRKTALDVYPVAEGRVIRVIVDDETFGNAIIIKHSENIYVLYAHLGVVVRVTDQTVIPKFIYVKEGEKVNPKTQIARSGTTGNSSGIHLHLAFIKYNGPENTVDLSLFRNKQYVLNPCSFLKKDCNSSPNRCVRYN